MALCGAVGVRAEVASGRNVKGRWLVDYARGEDRTAAYMIEITDVVTVTFYRKRGVEQKTYPTFEDAATDLMREMDGAC
jgi:hypothetical protein